MSYLFLRFASSFLTGILMSQAGSLVQLASRNILASPSTLGFDGIAIFWILLIHSLFLWIGGDHHTVMVISGLGIFVLLGFIVPSMIRGGQRFERIILIGLAFNLFISAVYSLWHFLFLAFNLPFPAELWFGHFRYAGEEGFIFLIISEILLSIFLIKKFNLLQVFSLGEDFCLNWNLNEKTLYRLILWGAGCSTFIVISFFGAFSLLGLIFPIFARKFWFQRFDLKGELFIGPTFNGILLMILDALCYFFPIFGAEIPVGLIVIIVGAVSLIGILFRSQKQSKLLANL
jgi:iron complex transport system permease protein